MAKAADKPKKPEQSQAELRAVLESRLHALKPELDNSIKEYEQALRDNLFEDADGESAGAGEQRKAALQRRLTVLLDRAATMKNKLASGKLLPQIPEIETVSLSLFLKQTFGMWYSNDAAKMNIPQRPELVDPASLDFATLKSDIAPAKFGEYTLNPECVGLDFTKQKIKVLDIQQEITANHLTDLASVAKYVIDTYSADYIIPDLSFWQWMIAQGANAPDSLKDDKWQFCFGSLLRSSDGHADVPDADWRGSAFLRSASHLGGGWLAVYRVVLLER